MAGTSANYDGEKADSRSGSCLFLLKLNRENYVPSNLKKADEDKGNLEKISMAEKGRL